MNTGYDDLDKKTAGLQPSDLIIVAARPSMGKTTFAMNLVENAAMLQDKPVLIFSLEMPSEQIMMRSLASLSRVDQTASVPVSWTMRTGRGSPHHGDFAGKTEHLY
ncbi:DnaB-like helicase C-terminal domain-containing protein [Enterobacter hormaechei]